MGVHMPPAGVVPPRVAHGRNGVGWVPQKQASVTQCSVFSIALGATRMPSGHVCTPCTDARRPHADRPSSGASASKKPQFAARSLSAPHGCPLATCARRARMPSGHMRIARPLTYTLHGLHVAPWLPSWPHARALGPPIVSSALTRRAHPLKTSGAMPGKSLEAHRCDITRPLPLRTIVSCLSMSPMPAAHAAAQPNLRIAC